MKKTKKVKSIISIIILAVAVIAVIIFFNSKPNYQDNSSDSQKIFRVQKMNLYDSVNIVGKCVSDTVDMVFSDVVAPVSEVCVKKGDYINAGDVICRLDVSDIEKQRDSYNKLLEEYEKYNSLKTDNYSSNLSYSTEIADKQILQLEETINSIRNEYDKEINNVNDFSCKYDEALSELENIKNEYDSVNAELESLNVIVSEYEAALEAAETVTDTEEITDDEQYSETDTEVYEDSYEQPEPPFDMEYYVSLKNRTAKLEELKEIAQNKVDFYNQKKIESQNTADALKSQLEQNEFNCEQLKIQRDYNSELTAEEYAQSAADEDTGLFYKEQIELLNKKINSSVITADSSGIVTDVFVSVGDYISENPVCQIQDQGNMHFESYINPNKISLISSEKRIFISMAANNFKQIEGKILDISDFYDAENDGYKITFTFDSINDMEIFPGFEAAAKIILREQEDTLAVPYDALIERDGKYYVKKVNMTDNSMTEVEVKKGLATSYYIAISSDEIKENDRVMTGENL